MHAQMNAIWDRLDARLASNAPAVSRELRDPATEAQIVDAERYIATKFPSDLRAAYLRHDGQHFFNRKIRFLPLFSWLPLKLMAKERDLSMSIMQRNPDANDVQEPSTLEANQRVRYDYWNPGWLPIAAGISGTRLCVDMAPARGGRRGQIIAWDTVERASQRVVADSFADFLQGMLDRIESGEMVYVEKDALGWADRQSGEPADYRWGAPSSGVAHRQVKGPSLSISPALAVIVGHDPLPRTEVTKKVWEYIKAHKLQDETKRTMINADEPLRRVFGGKAQVTMFEMTQLINQHLS